MAYYVTWSTLHLGNISDIDTDEYTLEIEHSSELLGTFGSTSDPLHHHITDVVTDSYDDAIVDTDNSYYYNTISYDLGDGLVETQIDSVPLMAGTVTFKDGSQIHLNDLSVFQDTDGNVFLAIRDDQTILAEQGIVSVELTSVVDSSYIGLYQYSRDDLEFVCYAPGTMIETPVGLCAVETLCPGDQITTLDHGPQEIRWVRHNDHPLEKREADDRPVLIGAGALGPGLPAQDLIVSPQHRILVGGQGQLQDWFEHEVFVPAKALTRLPKVRYMNGRKSITWIHFACDAHEVVLANGCLSESLLLGPMVVKGLKHGERLALSKIYKQPLRDDVALNGPPARECLKVGVVRRLIEKNLRDKKKPRLEEEIKKWDRDLEMEKFEYELLSDQEIPQKAIDTDFINATKRAG